MNIDERRKSSCCGGSAGFTLVEILLVMVIIGVLAGVVVVQFGGRSTEARVNATRSSIKAIDMAIEMYEMDTGKYPSGLEPLTVSNDGRQAYLKGGMSAISDSWGIAFALENPGTPKYVIKSAGPDSQMGTDDDIKSFSN